MLISIPHPSLGPAKTRLANNVSASATFSTVDNNDNFANNDYVVFGTPSEEQAEIVLLTGTTGTDQLDHTTGPVFAHSNRSQVFQIRYNQIEVYSADSEDGAYSLLDTIDIQIDEDETLYDDVNGDSSTWYKIRYKNVAGTSYSSYSDPVQGTGYTDQSLYSMQSEILEDLGDKHEKRVNRDRLKIYLKAGVRKLILAMIKVVPDYCQAYTTQDLTSGTQFYDLPDRFLAFSKVTVNYTSTSADSAYKVEQFEQESDGYPGTTYYETAPRLVFRGNQFGLRPIPTSSSGRVFLWFWQYPTVMNDPTDTHGLALGAREALISYALYRYWASELSGDDLDKSGIYRTDWRNSKADWVEWIAQKRQTGSNMRVKVNMGRDLYEFE